MTQTRTIQATGGNAATLNAFEALLAAANPITEPWIGEVNNEEITESSNTTFGSYGQTSTNTITIRPQTGEGFASLVDYTVTALDYPSTGARFLWTGGATLAWGAQMRIEGLAFRSTVGGYGTSWMSASNATGTYIRRCLIRDERGAGILLSADPVTDLVISNCAFIYSQDGVMISIFHPDNVYLVHNTFINTNTGNTKNVLQTAYGSSNKFWVYGCAAYTQNIASAKNFENNGGSNQGDYNVQNGTGASGGDALPSDASHSSTSGNIGNDFVDGSGNNTAGADLQPKAGGLLLEFIPSASALTLTSTIAQNEYLTDIRGLTRVGANNEVGCFQVTLAAAGGGWFRRSTGFTGGLNDMTGGFDG